MKCWRCGSKLFDMCQERGIPAPTFTWFHRCEVPVAANDGINNELADEMPELQEDLA